MHIELPHILKCYEIFFSFIYIYIKLEDVIYDYAVTALPMLYHYNLLARTSKHEIHAPMILRMYTRLLFTEC